MAGAAASAAGVTGILMDKLCSAKTVKGGQEAASKHERTCNLTANCSRSGYGVFTADNKSLTFDEAGKGDTIQVADLKLAE